jgi:proteasome assembly chaperone (PAC2) family protein
MPDELRLESRPTLKRPVLVTAFRGWNDGGQGASLAAQHLVTTWDAEKFADIDPEGFFDFQATRPRVSLVDGLTRHIDWPENDFFHASPGGERDAVLLVGTEPNVRWRTFTELVLELVQDLGIDLIVSLGALLADVPHTRPAPVTGAGSDPELVERLGLQASRYEGPTGIVGVLHDACRQAGIPSVSFWAAVPHYVSLAPSPRAALALCDRLSSLLDMPIDVAELEAMVEGYTSHVTEAVSSDEDAVAYVDELEQRVDLIEEEDVPSGESIAAELTRFLREREQGDDAPPEAARGQ